MPTIWNGFLELDPPPDLSSVRELKAGGSAVPEPLIRAFEERFGVPLVQGWGMTETSPLAAVSRLPAGVDLSDDQAYALRATQGRILPLVGRSRVPMQCSIVLLPAPDGPTTAMTSPG